MLRIVLITFMVKFNPEFGMKIVVFNLPIAVGAHQCMHQNELPDILQGQGA